MKAFSTPLVMGLLWICCIQGISATAESQDYEDYDSAASFISNKERLWPNGIIRYTIDKNFSDKQKQIIRWAMDMINSRLTPGCVQFIKNGSVVQEGAIDKFVTIVKTEKVECESEIGRPKNITDDTESKVRLHNVCFKNKGVIAHELLHSLGAVHEQVRYDRNLFLNINCKYCKDNHARSQFTRKIKFSETEGTPFDFYSIMLYRKEELENAATIDYKKLMSVKDFYNKRFSKMGKGPLEFEITELSAGDVVEISKNYNCSVRTEILEEYVDYVRDITTALVDNMEECLEKNNKNSDCLNGMWAAEDYLEEWIRQRNHVQFDTTTVESLEVMSRLEKLRNDYDVEINRLVNSKGMVSKDQLKEGKPQCP